MTFLLLSILPEGSSKPHPIPSILVLLGSSDPLCLPGLKPTFGWHGQLAKKEMLLPGNYWAGGLSSKTSALLGPSNSCEGAPWQPSEQRLLKHLIFHSVKGLIWPAKHHRYWRCSLNRRFYFCFPSMNMQDQINRPFLFAETEWCSGEVQGLCRQAIHPAMSLLGCQPGQVAWPLAPPYSAL